MSKILSMSNEESLANVLDVIYANPNRKFIFSKEFVRNIASIANYGKQDVLTTDGYVDIYNLENEKGDTMAMTFSSEVVNYYITENEEVQGYVLKKIATVTGKVVNTKPDNKEVVIIK